MDHWAWLVTYNLCLSVVVSRYKKLEQSMEEEGLTDEQVIIMPTRPLSIVTSTSRILAMFITSMALKHVKFSCWYNNCWYYF